MRLAIWLACAALAAAPAAAQEQTKILFNRYSSPQETTYAKVIKPWMDEIEAASDGRIDFVVPASSMAPPPEQLNLVKEGVADAASIFNAFLERSHPLIQLSMLPLAGATGAAEAEALWNTYKKYFEAAGEFDGVVLLGFFAGPPGVIATIDGRIESLSELSGKKVYSLPGKPAEAMGLLGAAVVPGPAAGSYELISRGTVDHFAGLSRAIIDTLNETQFVDSVLVIPGGIFAPAFSVFMSKDKFNAMSPQDQDLIMSKSGASLARMSRGWDDVETEMIAKYEEMGIPTTEVSGADLTTLEETWAPMRAAWIASAEAAGVDGAAAFEFYKSEVERLAGGS